MRQAHRKDLFYALDALMGADHSAKWAI